MTLYSLTNLPRDQLQLATREATGGHLRLPTGRGWVSSAIIIGGWIQRLAPG